MQTALHMAVNLENLKCIELLLNADARPDIPNASGKTAIYIAASLRKKYIINLILNRFYEIPLDIDTFKDFKQQTVRNILQINFPELKHKLPKEQPRKIDFTLLKYFLVKNDEKKFLQNLEKISPEEPIKIPELITLAAGQNFLKAVVVLLSKLDEKEKGDLLKAAEKAMERGHFKVFQEILKYDSNLGQKLILRSCEQLTTPIRSSIDHRSIRLEFLKAILALKNINVKIEDGEVLKFINLKQ